MLDIISAVQYLVGVGVLHCDLRAVSLDLLLVSIGL
jgi:hypothetical protein